MSANYDEDNPIAYFVMTMGLVNTSILLVAAPYIFRMLMGWICERRQSAAAWGKAVARIQASERIGSYKDSQLCVVCLNRSTRRCTNCRAVPYCSSKFCESNHWENEHKEECRLMEEINNAKGNKSVDDQGIDNVSTKHHDFLEEVSLLSYCNSSSPSTELHFWEKLDVLNDDRRDRTYNQIQYLDDQPQPGDSATETTDSESEQETRVSGKSKHDSCCYATYCNICPVDFGCYESCPRYGKTIGNEKIVRLITSPSNNKANFHNHCAWIDYCSEHCERYEWKSDHSKDSDSAESKRQSWRTIASDGDRKSQGRVSRRIPGAVDHAEYPNVRNRHHVVDDRSSSGSADSSCGSSSTNYATSSLHGW